MNRTRRITLALLNNYGRPTISELGPVLAEGTQDGYILKIHDMHPEHEAPALITDENRDSEGRGRMSVTAPNGEVAVAGKWMDWAEEHYPDNYLSLTPPQRAALEIEEQKKWGYKKMFNSHRLHQSR